MKKLLLMLSLCLSANLPLQAQGYFNLTQLSFLIADENERSPAKSNMAPSVVNINGYRFNEHVSMGVGIGMTALSYMIFPLFADFRVTFLKGNLSPVLAVKGGYAFANSTKEVFPNEYSGEYKNSGGGMFNPEIGFKITMSERADFMLTVGYWYQHVQSEIKNGSGYYYYGSGTHNRIADLNRLSFSVSFLFK
jgi:hypothetical protein